jgi:hypothetical protein
MSKRKSLSTFVIVIYMGVGAIVGGTAARALLLPRSQLACTQRLLDTTPTLDQIAQAQQFRDPCLNMLGGMANGYDPTVIFILGAIVMGTVGLLFGLYKTRSSE